MLIVVLRNEEYAILKSFAVLEQAPGVPGLDIPGIDFLSIAKGYGCDAARPADLDAIKAAVATAWHETAMVRRLLAAPGRSVLSFRRS